MDKNDKTYKIYYWRFNEETGKYETGVRIKEYKRRSYAVKVAQTLFKGTDFSFLVRTINVFGGRVNGIIFR